MESNPQCLDTNITVADMEAGLTRRRYPPLFPLGADFHYARRATIVLLEVVRTHKCTAVNVEFAAADDAATLAPLEILVNPISREAEAKPRSI